MTVTNDYIKRYDKAKEDLKHLSPVEMFEKLFDEEVIQLIVNQTNQYALQKNNHNFSVSAQYIKISIAILLFSGYHTLARERLYWSLDDDCKIEVVGNSMSRNRFQEIKSYVHLADNTKLDKNDKMAKVRLLMDLLNIKFRQWGVIHKHLSIDEAMVKYFGHHSAKQFIRGKPIRFGYKDWMLCSFSGYCYAFDTYCGAKRKPAQINPNQPVLPLGSKVVLELLENVENPSDHVIFFDNYFTSYDLMSTLKDMGFRATGTARANRIKKCLLQSADEKKKKERGYFDYQYDKKNSLLFVRWKDNSIVTMISNFDSIEPLSKVPRWSSAAKAKVNVPQPKLFSTYNSYMGGVNLHDQGVHNYRVSIQGKKVVVEFIYSHAECHDG